MSEQTNPAPVPAVVPASLPPVTPLVSPTVSVAPVATKSGSNTLLIVILVILGIVVICCGGSVVAWFVARAQLTNWAEGVGIDLATITNDTNSDTENNDSNNDDSADDTDNTDDHDEDGSACTTLDGEEGVWHIENDEDEDGKIDRSECEAEVVAPDTGTITGTLMFPSEFYPDDLEVCAEDPVSGALYDCVGYEIGAYSGLAEYTMELPEGDYYVYAQTSTGGYSGYKAYYSEFVECGMDVSCLDHTPIEVEVTIGDIVYGVDASDWYVY